MYFHPAYVSGNGFEGEGASGVMIGTSVTVFAINTKGMETGAVYTITGTPAGRPLPQAPAHPRKLGSYRVLG
jgi:hypothetical protein